MSTFGNNDLFLEFSSIGNNNSKVIMEESDEDWEDIDRWKKENEILRKENASLRKALRILTQPKQVKVRDSSKDGPAAQLLLYNNFISRNQRQSLEELLHRCLFRSKPSTDFLLRPQRNALQCPSFDEARSIDVEKAFVITNSIQFYNSYFCIDHLGDPLKRNETLLLKVPEYERGCLDELDGEVEKIENKDSNRVMRTCFNCGGKDHQLKDCPTPKNYKAINERKQKFLNMISSSPQAGTVRYHADQDDNGVDPRFAGFKPGIISQTLRDALGIGHRELPPYIYQMRMLGYPPGHLEEARMLGSGLSFYKEKEGKKSGDSDEEGGPVDVSKLIDYPGFNVAPEKHVIDRGMLPMDYQHSKEVLVSYHKHRNEILLKRRAEINEKEEQARKRHKPNHAVKSREDDVREVDMETSDVEDNSCNAVTTQSSEPSKIAFEQVSAPKDNGVTGDDLKRKGDVQDRDARSDAKDVEFIDVIEEVEAEEGEVLSSASSCCIDIENQSLSDGFELGDLDEDELELRRNMILKQLKMADNDDSDDVIYVSTFEVSEEKGRKKSAMDCEEVIELSDVAPSDEPLPPGSTSFIEDSPDSPSGSCEGDHDVVLPEKIAFSPQCEAQDFTPGFSKSPSVEVHQLAPSSHTLIPPRDPESPPARVTQESPESPQKDATPPVVDPNRLSSEANSSDNSIIADSFTGGVEDSTETCSTQSLNVEVDTQDSNCSSPSLPHRSRFAQGIAQFDNYYRESKSSGVYKRLRNVLKDSPKNKNKDP